MINQCRSLHQQRRDGQNHRESHDDEEEYENDDDPKAVLDTPCLHPADGWTHCPDDEESDDEHQEDRPKPNQQPYTGHDEDELDHRRGRYFEAHYTRFLVRGGLVFGK